MTARMTRDPACTATRHGDARAYFSNRCRCPDAITDAGRYENRRRLAALAGRPYSVPAIGTRRRLQALAAIGWTYEHLAERLGCKRSNVAQLAHKEMTWVRRDTALRVKALYDQLAMTPGPSAASARRAAAKGWLPPLAWDDDLIDLPEPELRAECDRQAAAMTDTDVRRADDAHRGGDRSPLIEAGSREHHRRRAEQRRAAREAA
jgi:transcriptional regulator with XRE-family HTH domain